VGIDINYKRIKEHEEPYWKNGNVLKLNIVMVLLLGKVTGSYYLVHMKWISFVICKMCLCKGVQSK
jgi:hypothetical protein